MSEKLESFSQEEIAELEDHLRFQENERQVRADEEEAAKFIDRWLQVIRSELQLMRSEGVDPYIAWLAVRIATDWWRADDHLGDLCPDPSER